MAVLAAEVEAEACPLDEGVVGAGETVGGGAIGGCGGPVREVAEGGELLMRRFPVEVHGGSGEDGGEENGG